MPFYNNFGGKICKNLAIPSAGEKVDSQDLVYILAI